MVLFLEILLGVLGVLLVLPAAVFCLENVLALVSTDQTGARATTGARPRLAVLIPAHNEQAGIGRTVASVLAQLREGDRVLVVADNCSDQTARAALDAGAEVTERAHETLRGKGYAPAHGLGELTADPPEIVVFIDADCRLDPGCLSALAAQVSDTGTVAQSVYVIGLPEAGEIEQAGPGVRDRVSAFAVRVKNESRPIGLSMVMGGRGPCLITGSGFALPWALADESLFATGDIVEDMTIGLELARAGSPPRICRGARVHSALPSDDAAKRTQRERWEHGHLETIFRQGLPLLSRGVFTLRPTLVLLGLELIVPPLSLLVMLTAGFTVVVGVLAVFAFSPVPAGLGAMALGLVLVGSVAGWWGVGREILPARELPAAAWYAVRKGPIYLGAVLKRQTGWVRTARDHDSPENSQGD